MNPEIAGLLDELEAGPGPTIAWTDTRERIHELHKRAETFEARGLLLKIYVTLMDHVEKLGLVKDIESFRETRKRDYNLLVISECVDDRHNVDPTRLLAVTNREIAAGHMDEDNELRKLAQVGDYLFNPPPAKKSLWSRIVAGLHRLP